MDTAPCSHRMMDNRGGVPNSRFSDDPGGPLFDSGTTLNRSQVQSSPRSMPHDDIFDVVKAALAELERLSRMACHGLEVAMEARMGCLRHRTNSIQQGSLGSPYTAYSCGFPIPLRVGASGPSSGLPQGCANHCNYGPPQHNPTRLGEPSLWDPHEDQASSAQTILTGHTCQGISDHHADRRETAANDEHEVNRHGMRASDLLSNLPGGSTTSSTSKAVSVQGGISSASTSASPLLCTTPVAGYRQSCMGITSKDLGPSNAVKEESAEDFSPMH